MNEIAKKGNDLFTLSPRNLAEAMEYAELVSNTSMVPKDYKGQPGNVLVAVQMGAELGLPPMQALQNIAVINGRPSLWGDALLAVVKGSPLCEYFVEEWNPETNTATAKTKRKSDPVETSRSFSFDDSKRAGLWGKAGPWSQYPQRMAQMRARSWAARDAFPDLLRGVFSAEESQDKPQEKEIKPEPEKTEATATRAEGLRAKLAPVNADLENAPETDGPSIGEVLEMIAKAQTPADLNAASLLAGQLLGSEKETAREAYQTRVKILKNEGTNNA